MLPLVITEEHVGTANTMPKRVLNRALTAANESAALHHRERVLKKVFRSNAARTRGFRFRDPNWNKRKEAAAKRGKARYGGKRALVFEGLLEDSIVDTNHVITSNKNQAGMRIVGPSYFRNQIADEVTGIMPKESDKMSEVANEELNRQFTKSKHRKKFRV